MYCFAKVKYNILTGKQAFECIRQLDQETAELVRNTYKNIQELVEYYVNFVYVHEALFDLEKWCSSVNAAGEYLTRNQHTAEKLCRSFLYEFRAYVDHLETAIKRKYGENSELCRLFKDKSGYAYDNIPEYAFTYHLRNCSQHCVNIVHSVQSGVKGVRPASMPSQLLADFNWNKKDSAFINGHSGSIDLQEVFEKTYNAIGIYQQPVVQYLLDHKGVGSDIVYLRKWGDVLSSSREEIFNWHFMKMTKSDGSDATMEDYKRGEPDLKFLAHAIDWKAVYEITDSLKKSKEKKDT